jgi:RNA polymerase sigma-70 factor (ECF subfamily)
VIDLPRDPEELLAHIYDQTQGAGVSRDGEALVWIADVLRSGLVPADLRAALFQAATGIPGVEVVDRRANLDGRVGVAVGRDERAGGSHFRQELIFDEATGQVIGERQVALEDDGTGIEAGDAYDFTSVTTTVVDSAP